MLLFVARKKNQSQDAVTAKECLKEYVANKDKWASDDQHCIALFNELSGTFFTQQNYVGVVLVVAVFRCSDCSTLLVVKFNMYLSTALLNSKS